MMARTSPSRTSKLTSVSAFTPPKASEMLSTLRSTSPMRARGGRLAHACTSSRASRAAPARMSANTFASRIRTSALILPLRPSSNFTSVST